eukprot:g19167.t1
MVEAAHQGVMAGVFRVAGDATNTPTPLTCFGQPQQEVHPPQLDAMATDDENQHALAIDASGGGGGGGGSALKRKSFAMSESPPALPPPTQGEGRRTVAFAPACPGAAGAGGGEEIFRQPSSRNRGDLAVENEKQQHQQQEKTSTQVSCVNVGETLRVPLSGKSILFRVVKRRGRGFSSVVFECEREREENGGPPLVTVKVMSGGESGMGACLHEVETLAFLKVKRQEVGLAPERSRFAELASWFYKRSAVGGVDHVCLVFRGGGLSLREAMSARSPPPLSAGGVALGSSGGPGASLPSLVWGAREVVEVARGLLEGIAFLHSVGLIHADIKPENIALYPPSPSSPPPSSPQPNKAAAAAAAKPAAPFDLRLIDLGNAVFAADAVPGVTAGTPSYLSPEAKRGLQWGPKVDVWAAGCVLYEILSGERVRTRPTGREVGFRSAWPGGFAGSRAAAGGMLAGLAGLVERLLTEDVDRRPAAEEALKDAVFSLK